MILSGMLNVMILKVCIFILYAKILFVTEKIISFIVKMKTERWYQILSRKNQKN